MKSSNRVSLAQVFFFVCLATTSYLFVGCGISGDQSTISLVEEKIPEAPYAILTDIPVDDPYFDVVRRLARHRSARIIPFSRNRLDETIEPLRRLSPIFVAFVVKPNTLDINFAYSALELSTKVDEDSFCDFAYGFITGATAKDAQCFVENMIRAEKEGIPRKIFAFGPSDITQVDDNSLFEWMRQWKRKRLAHKPGSFPQNRLGELTENGILRFWGHGLPEGIDNSLSYRDIQKVCLYPAVVFAGPCYSAVVAKRYEYLPCREKVQSDVVSPEASLALTCIARGVTGYFGALDEDLCLTACREMEYALTTGLPLGLVAKYNYDSVVLSGNEKILSLPRFREGKTPPAVKGVQLELQQTAARIYLGDPAFRPFQKTAAFPISTNIQTTQTGMKIRATLTDPRLRCMLVDPYRDNLCSCSAQNDVLYIRVELPKEFGRVKTVVYQKCSESLESSPHNPIRWATEHWFHRRYIHLQVEWEHDSLRHTGKKAWVEFLIEEDGNLQ